ncbi:MAG: SPFH domain-containing protein [Gemmataceae bacterium]
MRRLGLMLVAALLVLYLFTGVVQVLPGERAVVRRLGRVLDEKPVSGLWIGLPWGIDRVDRVEVDAVRSLEVGFDPESDERENPAGLVLTGDDNLLVLRFTLNYKVLPDEVADFVLQGERVPALLTRLAESAAAQWAAQQTVDEALLRGKPSLRAAVIAQVRSELVGKRLGVEVLDAPVSLIAPPEEVKDAFENVSREQTRIATERFQAEQEANGRRALMQAEVYRIEQQARATAHARKVAAQQEADRFLARLAQYQKARVRNPEYLRQLWQDERAKIFARLRENGQIDLLDRCLSEGGLDLLSTPGR